jgi:hypothetical protein
MQKQIENLINNAIDDFNSKWQSHEERNTGVSEYAEKIVNFISSNPVLADSTPSQECYKSGEPCKYDCSGLCKESC